MRITPEMLARQARYAGRSARRIAGEPALARDLPRLLATRGRGTMALRLPWLPFRLIDELGTVVGPGTRVFEYGGGGSTLWFLDRGATVVTCEHHPGWADELARVVGGSWAADRWTLLRRSDADAYAAYVAAIDAYPDLHFDVVVVDGRERARCATAALPKVAPDGLLLVDDVDRERYRAALDATGWTRRDIVGFAPAKPTLAYTAVLTRPA
ncbi:class I SAM-dependent methyltransferase [Nocardioides sp. SYSU D00038]|uniref:class I SAM-dependent methyltransferase n=1 Tax=Nocardioides sp. SYSU D00038 TaxID=2812554 RepID=UPI00196776D8|nr:class I SAM-dependent methyltransferase [Nocardioides sp. SYSU D00038]